MGRVRLIVAGAALAAAAVTVGIVLLTHERPAAPVDAEPPPLFLDFAARPEAEARALRRAARLYDRGRLDEAGAIFERYSSAEARVGAAFAGWPDDTLDRLRDLDETGVSELHLGVALAALGQEDEARAALDRVDRIAPDSSYAIRSDDFFYPQMVPGLPFFVTSREPAGALRRGLALQRLGRPLSARRAFDEAARRAPDPETLTAAAVARFDKDEPELAFARLGPLTRRFPRAQTVRFHLGLLLLWIADVPDARRQLERARALDPASRLGREADRFLDRL